MQRPIHVITLLVLGAALVIVIIRQNGGSAPGPVASTARMETVQVVPANKSPDFPIVLLAHQPVDNSARPATLTDSRAAVAATAENFSPAINPTTIDIGRELSQIATTNPVAALERAARLDAAQHPGDLMEDVIQQWAGSDSLAAAAWAKLNTTGEEQARLLQSVGFVLSRTSPVDAAEFVEAQIPAGPVQEEALMTVVNQWGNKDLAAAAAWVKTFPEGSLQQRAVIELEGIQNSRQALVGSQN